MAEVLFGGVNVDAFFLGVRQRPLRGFRAAALYSSRPSAGGPRADHHQKRRAGESAGVKRDSPRPRSTCRSSRSASARSAVSPPLKRGMPSAKTSNGKGPSGDLHRRRRLVIAFLAQRCTVMRQRCHPLRHYRPPAPHPAVFTTRHLFLPYHLWLAVNSLFLRYSGVNHAT